MEEQPKILLGIKKIKSPYILKKIFSLICFHKKLEMIIYNKHFQNKFELKLDDYKNESKKYRIIEANGIMKEYSNINNQKIFEGECKNNKKNGPGKEYYLDGKLKFVGKYQNGIKIDGVGYNIYGEKILYLNNNIGEEYYDNGKLQFIGEYFNGKKWDGVLFDYFGEQQLFLNFGKGYMKEYYEDGKLLFEGEYNNGERNGKGIEYFDEREIFEGEYLNGIRWKGHIKEYDVIRHYLKFEAIYLNGLKNGSFRNYQAAGVLKSEGEYLNDKINGKYKEYYDNGDLYIEGEYLNGEKNGIFIGYSKYTGHKNLEEEYLNGKKNGKVKHYIGSNLLFDGNYLNDVLLIGYYYNLYGNNGKMVMHNEKGELLFEGEFKNLQKNGTGKEYKDGKLIFEGIYLDGEKNGLGIEYYIDQKIKFDGEFKKGKKWNGKGYNKDRECICEIKDGKGIGKELNDKGNLIFEGEYINGEKNGKIFDYYDNGQLKIKADYKNNQKNGNVIEYFDNGKLRLEGEYLNGKKHGKILEYFENGKLYFEGEYLNGEKNGKGKEFNNNGELEFEGEYSNGKRWTGKGIEYNNNGCFEFEGEYQNGKRWNGRLVEYDWDNEEITFDGTIIEGEKIDES